MKEIGQAGSTLKREFGLFTVTLLVVGLLVGSGIFQKIVPMAASGLGESYILLAWLLAGIISLLGAFTVGGLSSLSEESGGSYEYFRISYGNFLAFLSGWADFMIIGTGSSAAIAFIFADSVNHIISIPNPLVSLENMSIAGDIFPFRDFGIKIVAVVTIIILTGINAIGTRESGVINNIITSVKIAGVLVIIVFGLILPVSSAPVVAGSVTGSVAAGTVDNVSIFLGMIVAALWAYDGWVFAANVSGEIINPKRNIPLALSLGISVTIVLYVLANYVYMHVLPLPVLGSISANQVGAVVVTETLLGQGGKAFVLVLVIICSLGAINSNVISLPRKYFRMAEEGFFFRSAARVNRRFKTPVVALVYSMVWTCILILSGSFETLSNLVIFMGYIFFGMLGIALLKLKMSGVIREKVFGYPVAPVLFILCAAALTVNEIWRNPVQSLLGLLLTLAGVPVYYLFTRSTSKPGRNHE